MVSFTPAQITTVPGTYPSGAGLISGATALAVDGGDIVYVADTGNVDIREIDSSGNIISVAPAFGNPPASIAVDSFGYIYNLNTSATPWYFSYINPFGGQSAFGYTYSPGTCTVSSPCPISSVGMGSPANLSIDANDNLFFEERTRGAAEMPVAAVSGGSGSFNLWYLSDIYTYSPGPGTETFSVDAGGNLYTSFIFLTDCSILEEPLYSAEGTPTFTRVAGAAACGFSGDGGEARGAEISSSLGEIAFDIAGDLYFADSGNQRIRRIDAVTGVIRTIAGNGTAGYTGDGGQATSAELSNPTGVAVNSQGDVYIISSAASGQVLRKVGPLGLLVFGNQNKGSASAAQLVTVTNTGNSAMLLTNVAITGANAADFKVDNTTTTCILTSGAALYSGQTCRIGVIFTPAAAGARAATLTLLDNTVNGADSVSLSGTGVLLVPTFKITAPANGSSFKSGTAVTFSVSVTGSGPKPTGTVQFKVDGTNYGSAVTLSTGTASTSLTGLSTGTHTLSATYSGDANYAAAGPVSVTITITAAAIVKFTTPLPATLLHSSTSVTLAVAVTSKTGPAPTGKVSFSVDGKAVGTATIVSEKASINVGTLAAGTHTVAAAYGGDKYHTAAKATEKITVSP